ncbi:MULTISPECIES: TVP38/TMEM64 family protein [Halorubrum]|uniref:TVP38/TMEM64 family protein n=1 Tax=Halorubrum persicum TaxID=1383844 RepID=A0A2G1WJ36_9EURY|nr:VTT domain-containing protein [Halorubrum persicum]PHQ38993.1 TVP38/TMEM64 family protein [Halorubrum persicum]
MNRRTGAVGYVLAGVALAAIASAAWVVSPEVVLGPLTWLADDPVRFGAALVALTAIRPLLAWPTTLLAVVAGFGYGWAGLPIGVAAMVATALPPYWLTRAGRVRAREGSRIADRLCGAGERLAETTGGVRAVTAIRLLPIPSDAVSVAAAGSGIRLRSLAVGTALGEFPWAVIGVAIGVSVDRLASGGVASIDPTAIVAMAGLGALLLAGPLYRTVVSDRASPTA